jgi:hypothetical protein
MIQYMIMNSINEQEIQYIKNNASTIKYALKRT